MDTSIFSEMNWLAILVAAVAYFMLGALWYSKALFSNQWIAHHKIDMNDPELKKGVGVIMFTSFLLFIVISICLGILIERMQLNQVLSGVKLGLLTGVGFSFAAISITYLYVKKPFSLHLIDGMYHVVGQILAAIIICLWQ